MKPRKKSSKRSSKKTKNRSSKPKADTSSSSSKLSNSDAVINCDVVNTSVAEFPRKAYPSLIFMEEYLKETISKDDPSQAKPFSLLLKMCGDKWKSMPTADKTPYYGEANKRNVLYEKNREGYNNWNSMSDAEKVPFIAKAKAPYLAIIAEIKKKLAEEGVITNFDETDTDETDFTDWDKDENFDFFAYIAFSEESKKPAESKKPVESENIREDELAFKIFRNEHLGNFKKEFPDDQSVYANLEGWYEKCPVYLEDNVTKLWESANKAEYIGKAKAMAHESKKPAESKKSVRKLSGPFCVFCQDYIAKYKKKNPNDIRLQNVDVNDDSWWVSVPRELLTKSYNLWNAMNDTQKARYVTRSENIRAEEDLAFQIFRNEQLGTYKEQYPDDESVKCPVYLEDNVTKLWESANKAEYIDKAKSMVQEKKERHV